MNVDNYCKYNALKNSCRKTQLKAENSNLCATHNTKGMRPKCYAINKSKKQKNILKSKDSFINTDKLLHLPDKFQKYLERWNKFSETHINYKFNYHLERKPQKGQLNKNILDESFISESPEIIQNLSTSMKSIVLLSPYTDLIKHLKKEKWIKMLTCAKYCKNKGIFLKSEINDLINYSNKCPFCNEEFKFIQYKKEPPYGEMHVCTQYTRTVPWIKIKFNLNTGSSNLKQFEESRYAYYPYSENGTLALWLIQNAFEQGKLFKMGHSLTHQKYGITFSNIHLRTSKTGGIVNHGYGKNPVSDLNNTIIHNLISECNSVDIYTPDQIQSFFSIKDIKTNLENTNLDTTTVAKKKIKRLFLKYQTQLSFLRSKHVDTIKNLDIKEHRLLYAYPHAILINILSNTGYNRINEHILKYDKSVVPLYLDNTTSKYRNDLRDKLQKYDSQYVSNDSFYPQYICNLTNLINTFPQPKKSFYVYRGSILKLPKIYDIHVHPIPFSTSLNQWLAISFPKMSNVKNCCLYRIKVTPEMNCVIMGKTPFESSQHLDDFDYNTFSWEMWTNKKKLENLSKYNQFEVLLPPGILKIKSIKKNSFQPSNNLKVDKYRNSNDLNMQKYKFPSKGITLIDVEYEPLKPSVLTPEDLMIERITN